MLINKTNLKDFVSGKYRLSSVLETIAYPSSDKLQKEDEEVVQHQVVKDTLCLDLSTLLVKNPEPLDLDTIQSEPTLKHVTPRSDNNLFFLSSYF